MPRQRTKVSSRTWIVERRSQQRHRAGRDARARLDLQRWTPAAQTTSMEQAPLDETKQKKQQQRQKQESQQETAKQQKLAQQ